MRSTSRASPDAIGRHAPRGRGLSLGTGDACLRLPDRARARAGGTRGSRRRRCRRLATRRAPRSGARALLEAGGRCSPRLPRAWSSIGSGVAGTGVVQGPLAAVALKVFCLPLDTRVARVDSLSPVVTKAPSFPIPTQPGALPNVATPPASEHALPEPSPDAITVLVVDDERSNVESLEKIFLREGMRVLSASDAKQALELVRTHRVHVVLTDLMMPGTTGLELLRAIKQVAPDVEVVLMTAFGSVEAAVNAMRDGAYDFVEKPLKRLSIVKSVRKAAERQKLVAENARSRTRSSGSRTARSSAARRRSARGRRRDAGRAQPGDGARPRRERDGQGAVRALHPRASARARGPFVAVNCAAIPETILESELFGHERGAFTGAAGKKEGRFAKAAGGTLLLDEIGELSPSVQVKLLRVLQEGEYEPLGGNTTKSDVRIVAATNRDLVAEVAAGGSARTSTTGSTSSRSSRRRSARAARTSRCSSITSSGQYCAKNGRAAAASDARSPREADGLRVAGQRAGARERHRARRRPLAQRDAERERPARPHRRRDAERVDAAHVRDRNARSTRSSCASSARRCGTRRATSRWPRSCSASRRGPSTGSSTGSPE